MTSRESPTAEASACAPAPVEMRPRRRAPPMGMVGDLLILQRGGAVEQGPSRTEDGPPHPIGTPPFAVVECELDSATGPRRLRLPRAWVERAALRERVAAPASTASVRTASVRTSNHGSMAMVSLAEIAQQTGVHRWRPVPRWLLRARALLETRALERVRMADVAARVGVHPVHLSRSFRRHFGVTMTRYLRELRIERACRALAGSAHSLARIAHDQGLADHGHLTREFATLLGTTPSALRALMRTRSS